MTDIYKSIGEVVGIYLKKEKANRRIEEGYFLEGKGLDDDLRAQKKDRQVSLFTAEGWDEIQSTGCLGLCTGRFQENIRLRGLKLDYIKTGSLIRIGEAVFQITEIGKSCFPECSMVREGISCPLSREAMFARVIKSGIIKVGDKAFIGGVKR